MDPTLPLVPDLDGFRAKVLTVKPRRYVCCICHRTPIYGPRASGSRLCGDPACWAEAQRLGWGR